MIKLYIFWMNWNYKEIKFYHCFNLLKKVLWFGLIEYKYIYIYITSIRKLQIEYSDCLGVNLRHWFGPVNKWHVVVKMKREEKSTLLNKDSSRAS